MRLLRRQRDPEAVGKVPQLPAPGMELARERERIEADEIRPAPTPRQVPGKPPQNREIEEVPVVGDEHVVAAERAEPGPHLGERRRVPHVRRRDPVNPLCLGGDGAAGADETLELVHDRAVPHPDRGEIDHLARRRVEVGGFGIDRDEIGEGVAEFTRAHQLERLEKPEREPVLAAIGGIDDDRLAGPPVRRSGRRDPDPRQHPGQGDLHSAQPGNEDLLPAVPRPFQPGRKPHHRGIERRVRQLIVPVLQHGAVFAHALRKQLLDQAAQGRMAPRQGREVLEGAIGAAELLHVLIGPA